MKMPYFLLFLLLFIATAVVHAQRNVFLRVYNGTGTKTCKGYFVKSTDSSVFIYTHKRIKEIPIANVGCIKTKRSVVHGVLVGALAGAVPMSVLGTIPNKTYHYYDTTLANSAGSDTAFLHVARIPVHRISAPYAAEVPPAFTRRTVLNINGNKDAWRLQRKTVEALFVNR